MLTVTFEELDAALAACSAPVVAAEAHGALCGALAADAAFDPTAWARELLPDEDAPSEQLHARNLLVTLAAETQAAFAALQLEIGPLLPDDDVALEARTAALAAWCTGYLYGLGAMAVAASGAVPDAVAEVMRDVGEISRASVDPEETEESSEQAYAELVEYLRASSQLVYEELAAQRAAGGSP
jgi:uncharacterized protein YgfB (UPF0149 family)